MFFNHLISVLLVLVFYNFFLHSLMFLYFKKILNWAFFFVNTFLMLQAFLKVSFSNSMFDMFYKKIYFLFSLLLREWAIQFFIYCLIQGIFRIMFLNFQWIRCLRLNLFLFLKFCNMNCGFVFWILVVICAKYTIFNLIYFHEKPKVYVVYLIDSLNRIWWFYLFNSTVSLLIFSCWFCQISE